MKIVIHILQRVFVREFYNSNAAFFLLVLGFCFGFMSGAEHNALAEYFVNSRLMLFFPIVVWTFYTLKIIVFNKRVLVSPRNEFIYNFTLLNPITQWLSAGSVILIQLMPVIGYGTFLAITAIRYNLILPILFLLLAVLLFALVAVILFIRNIKTLNNEKSTTSLNKLFNITLKRSYAQFFIEWLIRNDIITFLTTKFFCYLIIWGVIMLYSTDVYDARLLGIGLTIAFAGNLALIFQFQRFENYHFSMIRNLPLSLVKRLLNFLLVFILICAPELGLLLTTFPKNLAVFDLIQLIFFSVSVITLLYTTLYIKDIDLEKFTRRTFLTSMLWIVLILFKVPIGLIGIVNLVIGMALFKMYYYTFEYISTKQ